MNTNPNNSHSSEPNSTHPDELFPPIAPWPEPVDGQLLLDEILALLTRFVVLPKWAPETLTLWSVHTFGFYLRDVCPYIAIESPEKECGKSTLLTVLSHLVHRPVLSSNISSSASFHAVEELNPTLLIDEGDTNLRRNEEFRGILNAGYSKPNAFVWRMAYDSVKKPAANSPHLENDNVSAPAAAAPGEEPAAAANPNQNSRIRNRKSNGRVARFTCWCPKLIASIGRIHDVLASRCIVIRMHRKTEAEQCERTRFLDAADIKRKCVRFIHDNAQAIAVAKPQIPAGLTNRAADLWEPLFAIADLAGGRWPQLARQAAIALTSKARERNPIAALLLDILVLFKLNNADRFFSRDLVAGLTCFTDRPWVELRKGKAIDELWLAKQLRPYGIHPCSLRIGDQKSKGYYFEDFREVFKRYIPRSEFDALVQELGPAEQAESAPAIENGQLKIENPGTDSAIKNQSLKDGPAPAVANGQSPIENPPVPSPAPANANGKSSIVNPAVACPEAAVPAIKNPKSKFGNPMEPASNGSIANGQSPIANSPGASVDAAAPAIEIQKSKFENPQELCLLCSTPLNPVAPGQPRTQSHCNHCGTPISAPPGTSVQEKCPNCGEPQPLHGYNAERVSNCCTKCGTNLPPLKPGTPTPWLA